MSEFTEYEGKNVDKALEKAGKELDLPINKIEYDVISYGSTGIFGLVGVKKAKIRVKSAEAPKETRDDTKQQAQDLVKDAFGIQEEEEREPESEGDEKSQAAIQCGKRRAEACR